MLGTHKRCGDKAEYIEKDKVSLRSKYWIKSILSLSCCMYPRVCQNRIVEKDDLINRRWYF